MAGWWWTRHPKSGTNVLIASTLEKLEWLLGGTPADILLQSLLSAGIAPLREAISLASLESKTADQALEELLDTRQALLLNAERTQMNPNSLIVATRYWLDLKNRVGVEITNYHAGFPLRHGIPREELKSRLKLPARIFNVVIEKILAEGTLVEKAMRQNLPGVSPVPVISYPDHKIQFNPGQQTRIDKLLDQFKADPFAPPTIKTCTEEIGEDLYHALVDLGQLMPVSNEVVYRWEDYQRLVEQVRALFEKDGSISVAQMRDRFKTSRRYVLAFLEHLDAINLTIRDGDVRRLK